MPEGRVEYMKHIHNSKELRARRQELRRNATPQEIKLWYYLKSKKLGYQFYRQHSIGPYIVDFYCPQKKLIIEIDGLQHKEKEIKIYDDERTVYLEYLHHIVLRFWNREIDNNIDKVVGLIQEKLR